MNVNVTFSIAPKLLEDFDRWLKENGFKTRSEALVYLMRRAMPAKDEDVPY